MITVGSLFAGIGGFDLGLERAGMQVLWQVEKDEYRRRVLEKHWPEIRRYADVREVHGPYSYTHKIRCNGKGQHEEGSEGGGESRHQSPPLGEAGKERERSGCLEPVDLICGGFPCQPFSNAGKRRGKDDDRNLWPEFKRIIEECRPRWIVAENVLGLRTIYIDQVLSDLEGMGYATETVVVPAVAVNAPHRRDRFWIVAYTERMEWSARPKIEGKL
jgi:DNA (cytosine-5)-methyltransferase 1